MGDLFSATRRLMIARMCIDVVKLLAVAAVPTDFFNQLEFKSRLIAGLAMTALFVCGWLFCPANPKKEGE